MIDRIYRKITLNVRRARARRFVKNKLAKAVDWDAMARLEARHKDRGAVYFQYDQYLVRNAERVFRLGLNEGPPRRVLDIGCGFGYFMLACKISGHSVMGMDLSVEVYDEVLQVLGLEKVVCRIEPFQKLPPIPGGPFDLVTAWEICFDTTDQRTWGVAEWDWFLRDLAGQMSKDGGVFLKFNDKKGVGVLQGELLEYFRALGAEFDKRSAHVRGLGSKLAAMPPVAGAAAV